MVRPKTKSCMQTEVLFLQEIVGANAKMAERASWAADRKKFSEIVPTSPLSQTRRASLRCQRSEDGKENLGSKTPSRIMMFLNSCRTRTLDW